MPQLMNRQRHSRPAFRELGAAGVSSVEFALIVGFLSTLAIGVLDFGRGLWEEMQVGNAARAGAEYAAAFGWNSSAISNAVTNATGLSSVTATPAPSQSCGCPDASNGITTATCGSTCAGGGTAGTYVTANAQASYSTIFTYPGVSNPLTLSASATVRIN